MKIVNRYTAYNKETGHKVTGSSKEVAEATGLCRQNVSKYCLAKKVLNGYKITRAEPDYSVDPFRYEWEKLFKKFCKVEWVKENGPGVKVLRIREGKHVKRSD